MEVKMEEKKRGTGQRPAPDYKRIITKVHNICLGMIFIFIFMIIAGRHFENDRVVSVGIGIGITAGLIEVAINSEEDDDE
jgi:hypothetical protein